jgi:hypothetical protein
MTTNNALARAYRLWPTETNRYDGETPLFREATSRSEWTATLPLMFAETRDPYGSALPLPRAPWQDVHVVLAGLARVSDLAATTPQAAVAPAVPALPDNATIHYTLDVEKLYLDPASCRSRASNAPKTPAGLVVAECDERGPLDDRVASLLSRYSADISGDAFFTTRVIETVDLSAEPMWSGRRTVTLKGATAPIAAFIVDAHMVAGTAASGEHRTVHPIVSMIAAVGDCTMVFAADAPDLAEWNWLKAGFKPPRVADDRRMYLLPLGRAALDERHKPCLVETDPRYGAWSLIFELDRTRPRTEHWIADVTVVAVNIRRSQNGTLILPLSTAPPSAAAPPTQPE